MTDTMKTSELWAAVMSWAAATEDKRVVTQKGEPEIEVKA